MPIKTCQRCGTKFEARSIRASHCDGECFRAKERDYSRQHAAKFSPERRRAAILVQSAIYHGELIPQPCEACGRSAEWRRDVVAHHDDYAEPLNVRWLCRSCHKKHHVKFGPGKNAFRAEAAA